MNKWFRNEDEFLQHKRMMEMPELWPKCQTQMLHLKNPALMGERGSTDAAFAVLVENDEEGTDAPWLLHIGHGAHRTRSYFETIDQILEEGWVVD